MFTGSGPTREPETTANRDQSSGQGQHPLIRLVRRAIPATAERRRTLNIILLAVVIPSLLLSVALINVLAPTTPSLAVASPADATLAGAVAGAEADQTVQALERILDLHSQTIADIAGDSQISNAAQVQQSDAATKRLENFLEVFSEFESLAILDTNGDPLVIAGEFPTDFVVWSEVPAFQASLAGSAAPSVSPLGLEKLVLVSSDLSEIAPDQIDHLLFAAPSGQANPSGAVDQVVVGIIDTETLLESVQSLLFGQVKTSDAPGALVEHTSLTLELPVQRPDLQFVFGSESTLASSAAGPAYRVIEPQTASVPWLVSFGASGPIQANYYSGSLLSLNNLSLLLTGLTVSAAILAGWLVLQSPRAQTTGATVSSVLAQHSPNSQKASQRLVEAQETVRREVADYLHGHVQSKLLAVSMYMGICQKMVERNPEDACRIMERIQEELKRVQDEDLGQVSRELYPAIIKMGLVPALRSLVNRFEDLLEIDLSFDQRISELDAAGEAGLPEKRRLGIYRIAEEALNNVMKHGSASYAHITVTQDRNSLVLTIIDDGRGFETTALDDCHGLMMMRDYGSAIGGKTEITSSVRQGTSIRLVVPLSTTNSLASIFRKTKNPVSFIQSS